MSTNKQNSKGRNQQDLNKQVDNLSKAIDNLGKPKKGSKSTPSKGSVPTRSRKYGNDVKWWNGYKEISDQAAKIAFNNKAGEAEPFNIKSEVVVPGCLRIDYLQTMGKAHKWSDAVNLSMKALWLDLHRKYRGVGGYESADLGMALFAIADFFAQIAEAERMYGTMSKFDSKNLNTPYTVLMAEGAPLKFTGAELANFRADLNMIIAAAKTLCIPKGLPIFDAMIERCSGVYKDADNDKATFSLFRTPYYVLFVPTLVTTGSALKYVPKTLSSYNGSFGQYDFETLQNIITRLNDQLSALLLDSDVQRMCSDILAAYGGAEIRNLNYVLENIVIDYVKDDGIALQIHNARFLDADLNDYFPAPNHVPSSILTQLEGGTPGTFYIYQVDNIIHCDVAVYDGGSDYTYVVKNSNDVALCVDKNKQLQAVYSQGTLLDTWTEQPTTDEIIEMSRLSIANTYQPITSTGLPNGAGIEVDVKHSIFVPLNFSFFTNPTDLIANTGGEHFRNFPSCVFKLSNSAGLASQIHYFLDRLSHDIKYDWFPMLFAIIGATDTYANNWQPTVDKFLNGQVSTKIINDVVNIKFVNMLLLQRLHDACSMGAWKVQLDTLSIKE